MYIISMSRKMVSIQEAAEFLGVSAQTLRRWEREGKLIPDERTPGARRADGGAMTWLGYVPSSSMRPKRRAEPLPMHASPATTRKTTWNGRSRCSNSTAPARVGRSRS